jgi:hypothetical protein
MSGALAPPFNRGDRTVAVVVGVAVLCLRLANGATGPTDWDSAQYAAGSSYFDVRHGSPHPPGYFLFVVAGHLIHTVSGLSVITGLVAVAAAASAGAAACTWLIGVDMGGRWLGAAATALVALSPVSWFYGSIVSPYSFDALVACVLVLLARRGRPGSWHGVVAAVVLGLGVGFRQSMAEMFLPVALLAVVASTRTWQRLAQTALAGAASVAVWLVPLVATQPGGLAAWERATHSETAGALAASSIFENVPGGITNLGAVAALAVLGLGAAAVVGLVGAACLGLESVSPGAGRRTPAGAGAPARRPWYQGCPVVLAAAVVPQLSVVSLEAFDKPGYMLAYLPTASVALLLPAGRAVLGLRGRARALLAGLLSILVLMGALIGVERFVAGQAVLPESAITHPSLWLDQPRYGAPYYLTRSYIATTDRQNAAIGRLGTRIDPRRDLLLTPATEGAATTFRRTGWILRDVRVALVASGSLLYQERNGLLYYCRGTTLRVPDGGVVWVLTQPHSPTMTALAASGGAVAAGEAGGFAVWKVRAGTSLYGVTLRTGIPARPLGDGL